MRQDLAEPFAVLDLPGLLPGLPTGYRRAQAATAAGEAERGRLTGSQLAPSGAALESNCEFSTPTQTDELTVTPHEARPRSPPPPEEVVPGAANCSVALYLRVSTEDQDLAGQERDLRSEADRRGWSVTAVYAEKVSGTGKVERVEYERLLSDARKPDRIWTHLLVWSLDRFSREATFTRATQTILDLEAAGVRFHSLKESTLDTPEDGRPNLGRDVLLALLPVISAFESKRRSERVRVAMRELREGRRLTRSGRPPGRPRRVTPELAARVRELRSRGLPWKEVAQHVGLPAGTCRKIGPDPAGRLSVTGPK